MIKNTFLFVAIALLLGLQSCQYADDHGRPKYVFLFIGDGMGLAQVNLTEAYLAAIENKKGFEHLSFTQFPATGLVSTHANNRFITCSAAAATAFSTGSKTNIGRISTDSTGEVPLKSIATICKENGMKVGVVSSVSIDHATPAAFYAHEPSRKNYFEIGLDLANSDFDFFGGGGFLEPDGQLDGKETNVLEVAKANGFHVVNSRTAFQSLKPFDSKVIAVYPELIGGAAMPYAIDKPEEPMLADFTAKAIQMLENPDGFFLMVEGGKIDWACHSDDAATAIGETLAFDEAIQVALDFYKLHPEETLIVVTADHETGGLALGADKTKYETFFQLLQHQRVSYDRFNLMLKDLHTQLSGNSETDKERLLELVAGNFGLGKEIPLTAEEEQRIWDAFEGSLNPADSQKPLYGEFSPVTAVLLSLMSEKAGVGWTTHSHTGIHVPIYAIGPGSEHFSVVIDNTDIPEIFLHLLGIEHQHTH